jgi:hypothetical protein
VHAALRSKEVTNPHFNFQRAQTACGAIVAKSCTRSARCKIDPLNVIYDFCFMTLGEERATQGMMRPLHPRSRLMTTGESWRARNTQHESLCASRDWCIISFSCTAGCMPFLLHLTRETFKGALSHAFRSLIEFFTQTVEENAL